MGTLLEFTELKRTVGYQPREFGQVSVVKSIGVRHCRVCNTRIIKGESFVKADSHLSSGYRSDINICASCIKKLAREV